MEKEFWIDIPGFKGHFQVSSFSRIRSTDRYVVHKRLKKQFVIGKVKNQFIAGGYYRVSLSIDGIEKQWTAHRLIALVFIPNPENKSQVNHINGNKLDNRICNLEWVTPSENSIHAWENGLRKKITGKDNHRFGKTGFLSTRYKKVINIDTGVITVMKDAYKNTEYSYSHFVDMMNGKYKNRTNYRLYDTEGTILRSP